MKQAILDRDRENAEYLVNQQRAVENEAILDQKREKFMENSTWTDKKTGRKHLAGLDTLSFKADRYGDRKSSERIDELRHKI